MHRLMQRLGSLPSFLKKKLMVARTSFSRLLDNGILVNLKIDSVSLLPIFR
jgi:hypothetical protein